jgi:hypothetical protein
MREGQARVVSSGDMQIVGWCLGRGPKELGDGGIAGGRHTDVIGACEGRCKQGKQIAHPTLQHPLRTRGLYRNRKNTTMLHVPSSP